MTGKFIVLKIIITMTAFAANSVICRIALRGNHIDPVTFTDIRLLSGAVVLLPFFLRRGAGRRSFSLTGALSLMVYAMCFALAYIHLDTGAGALLLFGVVQLAMVIWGLLHGDRLSWGRAAGLTMASGGLLMLLLPGATAPPAGSALIMALAGLAWAAYTLAGKKMPDAAVSTSGNFLGAAALALIVSPFFSSDMHADGTGIVLAIMAGAAASAGAYVLWYSLLPHLDAVTASTVQLSVPCLAMLGGVLFTGELLSLKMILSAGAVLGGIALVIGFSRSGSRLSNPEQQKNRKT